MRLLCFLHEDEPFYVFLGSHTKIHFIERGNGLPELPLLLPPPGDLRMRLYIWKLGRFPVDFLFGVTAQMGTNKETEV